MVRSLTMVVWMLRVCCDTNRNIVRWRILVNPRRSPEQSCWNFRATFYYLLRSRTRLHDTMRPEFVHGLWLRGLMGQPLRKGTPFCATVASSSFPIFCAVLVVLLSHISSGFKIFRKISGLRQKSTGVWKRL